MLSFFWGKKKTRKENGIVLITNVSSGWEAVTCQRDAVRSYHHFSPTPLVWRKLISATTIWPILEWKNSLLDWGVQTVHWRHSGQYSWTCTEHHSYPGLGCGDYTDCMNCNSYLFRGDLGFWIHYAILHHLQEKKIQHGNVFYKEPCFICNKQII